jgi:hypothetical protein
MSNVAMIADLRVICNAAAQMCYQLCVISISIVVIIATLLPKYQ